MAEVDALAQVQISPRGSMPVALGRYAANAILASEWLAARDREVAAKTLREAAQIVQDTARQGGGLQTAEGVLRAEADRIEKGPVNEVPALA